MLKCGHPSSNFTPTGAFLGGQEAGCALKRSGQTTSHIGAFPDVPSIARSVISVLAIDFLQSLKKLAEIGQRVQKLFWGERGK